MKSVFMSVNLRIQKGIKTSLIGTGGKSGAHKKSVYVLSIQSHGTTDLFQE